MNTETNVTANREYKSTIFARLFSDKEGLLSLYNALNHSNYTNENDLEIVTLDNAIYMSMKNDLAFILDSRLNLYEHQSTPNPNMPLRDLFYVSKEYEKLINRKTMYSRRKLKIPAPHFVVFYNGMIPQPEREILKLSDLYEIPETEPMLELQVLMLNINDGNNEALKESCHLLKEYMQYVNLVRKCVYEEKRNLNDAVEYAVNECIKKGVLEKFLRENCAEVIAVSIFEFDKEREMKLIKEDEYQYGVEEGMKQGIQQGMKQGIQQGIQQGRKEEFESNLNSLVTILSSVLQDFDAVYNKIISDEKYKNITREQVEKYYYAK